MNAGPIIHPPLITMNAGPLEHFPAWDIHNEGTQPAIRRATDALDKERISLREKLGYGPPHFPLRDHYAKDGDEWMYGRAAHDRLTDSGDWREKIGLTSHRYMLEDVAIGLSFMTSVARWAKLALPLSAGYLAIGSAILERDLYAEGRTFENLRLAALSPADLRRLLYDGVHTLGQS
jgi:opine dehydrogenase